MATALSRPRVVLAVCTFNRNEELAVLLECVASIAERNARAFAIGAVVVDDSADAKARAVAEKFAKRFELGTHYRHSGARNISVARNMALETAMELGDWIAMTDDDCEPGEDWLSELLRVQRETGADVVTGPLFRRAHAGAPAWISDQPFLNASRFDAADGARLHTAFTNNCLIASAILRHDPKLRFRPEFGRIGGEDTVFFHGIADAGHTMHFARHAVMFENEVEERLTLSYQLRRFFWYGNTSVQTSRAKGVGAARLAKHGVGTIVRALGRPIGRVLRGERPHMLYALAEVCNGAGKLAGVMGVKVNHK